MMSPSKKLLFLPLALIITLLLGTTGTAQAGSNTTEKDSRTVVHHRWSKPVKGNASHDFQQTLNSIFGSSETTDDSCSGWCTCSECGCSGSDACCDSGCSYCWGYLDGKGACGAT